MTIMRHLNYYWCAAPRVCVCALKRCAALTVRRWWKCDTNERLHGTTQNHIMYCIRWLIGRTGSNSSHQRLNERQRASGWATQKLCRLPHSTRHPSRKKSREKYWNFFCMYLLSPTYVSVHGSQVNSSLIAPHAIFSLISWIWCRSFRKKIKINNKFGTECHISHFENSRVREPVPLDLKFSFGIRSNCA